MPRLKALLIWLFVKLNYAPVSVTWPVGLWVE